MPAFREGKLLAILDTAGMANNVLLQQISVHQAPNGMDQSARVTIVYAGMGITWLTKNNVKHYLSNALLHINGTLTNAQLQTNLALLAVTTKIINALLTKNAKIIKFGIKHLYAALAHQARSTTVIPASNVQTIFNGFMGKVVPVLRDHSNTIFHVSFWILLNARPSLIQFGIITNAYVDQVSRKSAINAYAMASRLVSFAIDALPSPIPNISRILMLANANKITLKLQVFAVQIVSHIVNSIMQQNAPLARSSIKTELTASHAQPAA